MAASLEAGLRDAHAGASALVVVPDAAVRAAVTDWLRFAGIAVTAAPASAAAAMVPGAAGRPAPQLVLVSAPLAGEDAGAFLRGLRTAGLAAPIVVLAAATERALGEACLAAGASDWLALPLDADAWEGMLARWLAAPRPAAADAAAAAAPAAAPYLDLPGIDVAGALEHFADERTLFERALVTFVRERRAQVEGVETLLAAADREPLGRLLHRLAGSAGMLCAGAVYAAVRDLEGAVRSGDGTAAVAAAQRLRLAFREVAAGVERAFP